MGAKALSKIKGIVKDIKSIRIQGATNVAFATLEGIKLYSEWYVGKVAGYKKELKEIGDMLSLARDNEPLARNAVKYVLQASSSIKASELDELRGKVETACSAYESMLAEAKVDMIKFGTEALAKEDVILTHCHSSSAITIIKNVAQLKTIEGKSLKVVATETRPLYQGRKTAKELFEAGLDVTQIVDSACASFITEDKYLPVGAVIVGCDELLKDGSFINKVGTFAIALAAHEGVDEFYVATTLLKLGLESHPKKVGIEERESSEVWDKAPKGLKIINPAFEQVDSKYVTGYITEAGVLRREELIIKAREVYPWLWER
ncbi:hypothetical protein JW766_03920 [Candidatus Dojkabacteria bacterium]|nr:hypothetical protein [Candidatus Dojkabacteria bacterium]